MENGQSAWDWERAIVLELNREHEYACRIHRVNLRPIAITLFNSETVWGQFDGLTRTISISRKLVNEHPWHSVVGVFRHEMAHQLVAEERLTKPTTGRSHDELFKEACRRLGIPGQFARAGLDLQNCDLDWRHEPRDSGVEKILDKVKKLLALASSTNEHEALLAMARVRELYAKYNLDHVTTLSKEQFVHLVITHSKKRMQSWEQRIISILTEHFFVKVLFCQQFDPETGKHAPAVEIIGARENVLMAEYVYYFLRSQVEFLVTSTTESGMKFKRSERNSFRLGVLDGFAKKLKSAEKDPIETSHSTPANSRQLTVVGEALQKFHNDQGIEDYLSEIYPRLGRKRESAVEIDGQAFAAGHAAGKSITLNKPITSDMGNRGNLLSQAKSGRGG
jgi:hypothetical protein